MNIGQIMFKKSKLLIILIGQSHIFPTPSPSFGYCLAIPVQ